MVMSANVARYSIVTGIIELVVSGLCIIIGVAAAATVRVLLAWAGIWTFVYIIPGILVIMAGKQKNTTLMAVSLGFNIVATVTAVYVIYASITLWVIASNCRAGRFLFIYAGSGAVCTGSAIGLAASVTIFTFILIATSFTSSILGCMVVCTSRRDQTTAHTSSLSQPSATVVISTQNSAQSPAYNDQQMRASLNPAYYNDQQMASLNPPYYNDQQMRASLNPAYYNDQQMASLNPAHYNQQQMASLNPAHYNQQQMASLNPAHYNHQEMGSPNPHICSAPPDYTKAIQSPVYR